MWQKSVRYLDYNAGAGFSPTVQQKLIEILQNEDLFLANPSSRHRLGQRVQHLLYSSATKVMASISSSSFDPAEITFTSSGTEANQTLIRSAIQNGDALIIGAGEHSASYDLLEEARTTNPAYELPLLPNGQYDLSTLSQLIETISKEEKTKRIFLSLFWANNETGVITDLEALRLCIEESVKKSGVPVVLHLDGAQAWGKIEIDVKATPATFITFSAHKIGAPAGTGIIWTRPGAQFAPLITGSQARGQRGGTENVLGILATGLAAEALSPEFSKTTTMLRDAFEQGLAGLNIPLRIWGKESNRIGNTSRFSFLDFQTYENWVELLDLQGFAVSHGSACRSNVIEPSRVLLAMKASRSEALNSIRVSFGPENTLSDVKGLLEALHVLYHKKQNHKQQSQSMKPNLNAPFEHGVNP